MKNWRYFWISFGLFLVIPALVIASDNFTIKLIIMGFSWLTWSVFAGGMNNV
jgi:hypothetical protein